MSTAWTCSTVNLFALAVAAAVSAMWASRFTLRGSTLIKNPGSYGFNGAGLVVDVQFWVGNPGLNYGWILITGESFPETVRQF